MIREKYDATDTLCPLQQGGANCLADGCMMWTWFDDQSDGKSDGRRRGFCSFTANAIKYDWEHIAELEENKNMGK